MNIIICALFT